MTYELRPITTTKQTHIIISDLEKGKMSSNLAKKDKIINIDMGWN